MPSLPASYYHGLLDALPSTGVIATDAAGRIAVFNQAAEELLGYRADEVIGQMSPLDLHVPEELAERGFAEMDLAAWVAAAEAGGGAWQCHLVCKDGRRRPVHLTVKAIRDGDSLQGYLALVHAGRGTPDFGLRRTLEGELKAANQTLEGLVRVLPDAVVFKGGDGHWLLANQAAQRLFGLRDHSWLGQTDASLASRLPHLAGMFERMACRDREAWSQHGATMSNETYQDVAGSARELQTLRIPLFKSDGTPQGLVTVWRDVTEECANRRRVDELAQRNALQQNLLLLQQRLSAVIEHFHGAVLLEDEERKVAVANHAFCELFNLCQSPATLLGQDSRDLAGHLKHFFKRPERFRERLEELVLLREPTVGEEWTLLGGRVLERDYVPIRVEDGYSGHLWIYRDITERKMQELELRRLATTDALTGLSNRRHFIERLTQEFARYERYAHPAAVLMLDIDFFKSVNDSYGHAAGDALLRRFAAVCQRVVRRTDVVGRLGGEEFAVMLLDRTDAEALEQAERIREAVAALRLDDIDPDLRVTVSIGVSSFESAGGSVDAALARADRALYQAKENGRNRVVVCREPLMKSDAGA
jgi:diguanylate cyclase (GGDEF)-like protein/PAS domain S-box-containing protein